MLPNFFIVGAAKSGTTSLDRYLNQHPDIFMASRKETHFFATPDMPSRFTGPGDEPFTDNLIFERDEFESMFDGSVGKKVIGESSVYYLYYPNSAKRIAEMCPDSKILMVLREPADRAYSAYMHLIRDGRETGDFASGLASEKERQRLQYQPLWYYTDVGRYAPQVQQYFDVFGRENVKVILHDEFDENQEKTLHEVFAFLKVPASVQIDTSVRYNATGVPMGALHGLATQSNPLTRLLKPLVPQSIRTKMRMKAKNMTLQKKPMDEDIRLDLQKSFLPDIAMLEDVLGRKLDTWKA